MSNLFKKAAIKKCHERLGRAREALLKCRNADSYNAFSSAWTDFLMAGGAIINVLESASQHNARARQWFGVRRKRDRADPLLRYMYQARNAEEHGLEPVVHYRPSMLAVGLRGQPVSLSTSTDQFGNTIFHAFSNDGRPLSYKHEPARPVLVRVVDDRFGGSFYDPPTEHFGRKIEDNHPLFVAELYTSYLEALLEEAETLT